MGTSLSGLTPATTFDGLLKVGDNDPLTADLKAISTGDGTDTILSLSDSALSIGGETTIQIPTTGTILQVGNSSNPTQQLRIEKPYDALNLFDIKTSGGNPTRITMYDNYMRFGVGGLTTRLSLNNSGNLGLGIEDNIASARAHIKGSGTTSATTSLLVQNSAGTQLLKVDDQGALSVGYKIAFNAYAANINDSYGISISTNTSNRPVRVNGSSGLYVGATSGVDTPAGSILTEGSVGIGETTPTARLHVKGSGNNDTTTSLLVQNSDGTDLMKVDDSGGVTFTSDADFIVENANGANNFVVEANETTLVSSNYSLSGARSLQYPEARFASNVGVGATTAPTARLQVKGSGNSSATNAFFVENSTGNDLFRVVDNGLIYMSNDNYIFSNSQSQFNNKLGIGTTPDSSTQLHVKGSGATSATTALLVQNSAGSELFKLTDDGTINLGVPGDNPTIQSGSNAGKSLTLGSTATLSALNINLSTYNGINYTPVLSVTGNTDQFVGIGETTPTARLHVAAQGNTINDDVLLLKNTVGNNILKVSGNSYMNLGGASGEGRILLDNAAGNAGLITANTNGVYIIGGSNASQLFLHKTDGSTTIGNAATPLGARLGIKGSGATSATTALLVQNSAGTELFKIQDNYTTQITTDGGSSPALYLNTGSGREGGDGGLSIGSDTTKFNINSRFGNGVINASSSLFLTSSVGIGGNYTAASSGTARLFVKGSGNDATTTALLVQNSDGDDMLKVGDDGATTIKSNGSFSFETVAGTKRIEVKANGEVTLKGGQLAAYSNYNSSNSSLIVGGFTSPTAQLQVKGSGATSATTALLVENSAGTELLKVEDGGTIAVGNIRAISSGNIGVANNVNWHFRDIYSKGVTHITDNTTSSTTLDASAKLQVDSTTQGFLPPRMTDAEKNAIATPAAGLMVYDTDANQMSYWNGGAWINF
jgi:hypothetical protein